MAVVYSEKTEKVLGIITLEDVIEELLHEEIQDETDKPLWHQLQVLRAFKKKANGGPQRIQQVKSVQDMRKHKLQSGSLDFDIYVDSPNPTGSAPVSHNKPIVRSTTMPDMNGDSDEELEREEDEQNQTVPLLSHHDHIPQYGVAHE